MLKLLRKVVHDVTTKHSQFVPLYTELYHYYETHSVSFTNTDEHLIIQIMIGTVYPDSSLKCNLLIYFQDSVSWHLPKSYKEHLVTAHVLHGAVNHAQCWPIGTLHS